MLRSGRGRLDLCAIELLAEEISRPRVGGAAWCLPAAYRKMQKARVWSDAYEARRSKDWQKPRDVRNQQGRVLPRALRESVTPLTFEVKHLETRASTLCGGRTVGGGLWRQPSEPQTRLSPSLHFSSSCLPFVPSSSAPRDSAPACHSLSSPHLLETKKKEKSSPFSTHAGGPCGPGEGRWQAKCWLSQKGILKLCSSPYLVTPCCPGFPDPTATPTPSSLL